jgi:hypothetical protein
LCDELAWWSLTHQRDELAVIGGAQAARATGFGSISQTVETFRVKAVQATSHRLWAAMQRLRNRFDPLAIPTACHHPRMQDPIGWSVSTSCQFAHLLLFLFILCRSHLQELRHRLAPFPQTPSLFYHLLTNAALGLPLRKSAHK